MTPTKKVPVTTILVTITVVKQIPTPTNTKPSGMAMPTAQPTEITENQELSTHLVRPVAKRTTPQRMAILEPVQQTARPSE